MIALRSYIFYLIKMLHSQGALIFLLYKFQQRFLNKLASKFAKLDMIRTLKEAHKSFSDLDVSIENLNIIY